MNPPAVDVSALTDVATLSTPRLRLEPLGVAHLDGVWEGLLDDESMRLTGTRQVFTREAVVRHLDSLADRDDRADWAIVELGSEEYVGEIVLNELEPDDASMNFRIALNPGRLGRGFGTEATRAVLDHAFDRIGLHRVSLDVFSFNPRAQRSYEKAGFRYEGRQRDTLFWDGEWVDSILMSVLSTDERPAAPEAADIADRPERTSVPRHLSDFPLHASVAVSDIDRAVTFYEGTLRLPLARSGPSARISGGSRVYRSGGDEALHVYQSTTAGTSHATVATWHVDDLDQVVDELAANDLDFLRYDGLSHDARGITARAGGGRIVWFADPDGNTFALESDR